MNVEAGKRRPPTHFRPGRMVVHVLRRLAAAPFYFAGRLHQRDPRTWVFGNGLGFRDSPRYLAEHIAASYPDIHAVWIARTQSEAAEAMAHGVTAAIRGSREARSMQRRAGAAFLCIGINDLESVHLGGSYVAMLYHGTPIKRVLLDAELHRLSGSTVFARLAQRLYRWSLRQMFSRVDMFVASGDLAKERFATAFGCRPESIRVLGSPRFDVILGATAPGQHVGGLRARLEIAEDDYLVLWLPTWRERGDASWLPSLEARVLESALHGSRARLVVKPHANSDLSVFERRLPQAREIRLIRDGEMDVHELLHETDALITDYSSTVFDFAVLQRPIFFFAPDLEEYDDLGRGLYESYDSLTDGRYHRTWESLLSAVAEEVAGGGSEGMQVARHVGAHARNVDTPGSSERIVHAVSSAIGITGPGT